MAENIYLLKVAAAAESEVMRRLQVSRKLSHVRLATLAPLSNYGYPAGTEGALVGLSADGVVVGADGRDDVPRSYVPWANVSYLADGTELAKASG